MANGRDNDFDSAPVTPSAGVPSLRDVWRTLCAVRRQLPGASYEQWLGATADRCQCSVQHVVAAAAIGAFDTLGGKP